MKQGLLALLCLFAAVTARLAAQTINEAQRLSQSGKYTEAARLFDAILEKDQGNVEALVGAGYNLSWQKQYEKAQTYFEKALLRQPANEQALAGMGYNAAWWGRYKEAQQYFSRLGAANPSSTEARKGSGYVYLYNKQSKKAGAVFKNLLAQNPGNTEYSMAVAQAYLLQRRHGQSRKMAAQVLAADPGNEQALQFTNDLKTAPAFAEVDAWGGYSSVLSENRAGLRNISAAIQTGEKVKALLRYDNSLALDNRFFARQNLQASTYFAGAAVDWNSRYSTRAEAGMRSLAGGGNQRIIVLEQTIFVNRDNENGIMNIRLGGMNAAGAGRGTEWMGYGGLHIPFTKQIAVEPVYYYSRVTGGVSQHRLQGGIQYRYRNGMEISAGAFRGYENNQLAKTSGNIYGGFITGFYPVSRKMAAMLFVRTESGIVDRLAAAGLGLRFRFDR